MAREFTDASPPCQCGFVYGRMTRIYETGLDAGEDQPALPLRFCNVRTTAATSASISLPLRSG